jgi:hypothetical protein
MTRLTIAEAPTEEFSVRGRNAITEANDEGLVFYDDVTKVHVLPEEHSFTIQVITPDLEVEMDFPMQTVLGKRYQILRPRKSRK